MASERIVLWLRNDLRLTDNEIVSTAAKRLSSNRKLEVVPVYCFDPRFFGPSQYGPKKTGAYRGKFLLESVQDLKLRLNAIGSDLLVYSGKPEDVLPTLMNKEGKTTVFTNEEVTDEELRIDRAVQRAVSGGGGELKKVWGYSLFHKDDLPFQGDISRMPDVFTPFKEKCERGSKVRPCFPAPGKNSLGSIPEDLQAAARAALPTLKELGFSEQEIARAEQPDPRGVMVFKGGESAGLARIQEYIWDQDRLKEYFETRNGMIGAEYSSKFSPWLAHGCISPRAIYHECQRYERERVKNKSTYWLVFELIWRDFMKFWCLKHGTAVFQIGGIANRRWTWEGAGERFERWVEGKTGQPLVDANMRELKLTGFMSNRGRQNVASYLTQDLNVDWRLGAAYFEEVLIDHEVTANWGNWNAAAGVTGGRVNRFNILKQSKDYDEKGDYCRLWCPELANVPPPKVHSPWQLSQSEQDSYGVAVLADRKSVV